MIEALFALALMGGAVGVGQHVLHLIGSPRADRAETAVFSMALGLGSLILLTLALGLLSGLYSSLLWGVVGVWCIAGWRGLWLRGASYASGLRTARVDFRSPYVWLAVAAGLAMLFNLLRALVPPHGATDPLAYQLALPRLYLLDHELGFHPTITGALYPANMGLLYVVALALRNGILAQILHLSLACGVCAGIFAVGRRYFSWQGGLFGAAIFASVPVVVIFAPQGYVDIGLCFFQFTAIWAVANWARAPHHRSLLLAAILGGLAAGVKHQGLSTLLVGVLLLALRRLVIDRDLRAFTRDGAFYLVIGLALLAPWYLRAFVLSGNPVWPLANGVFNGVDFGYVPAVKSGSSIVSSGGSRIVDLWHMLVPQASWFAIYARSMNPWYWTFEPSGWQKAIGVYFVALLPGVLLFLRRRSVWQASLFCLGYYVLLIRVLHMNPRYGLILFAVASVLCGDVIHRLASASWRPIRILFLSGFLATCGLNLAWSYVLARPYFEVALGIEGRDVFLTRTEANYRLMRFVNYNTSADSRLLLQGIVKGYYCERDYLWDHPHQAVLRYEDAADATQLLSRFADLGITHVARMIQIPQGRLALGYPQYFIDPYHEEFRSRHLKLVYQDESFVLFEVDYPAGVVVAEGERL